MPKIDIVAVPQSNATGYPSEHAATVQGRWYRRIGTFMGLADFGVSHVVLQPGASSSQRHWHEDEDEFIVLLAGEAVLVEEGHAITMRAGDMAAFVKGDPNGHCLRNDSTADCVFLAFGRPSSSDCHYPDVDLHLSGGVYRRKDGSLFP